MGRPKVIGSCSARIGCLRAAVRRYPKRLVVVDAYTPTTPRNALHVPLTMGDEFTFHLCLAPCINPNVWCRRKRRFHMTERLMPDASS